MEQDAQLEIIRFEAQQHDLTALAEVLSGLKALASRNPTPVTAEQLKAIDEAKNVAVLLLQRNKGEVVGMVHASINHLEDRAHLGPIAVDKTKGGWGTPLMEAIIAHVREHFPDLRRIDLTNRPDHDYSDWYEKFGFKPRTPKSGDPSVIFRLNL